MKSETILWCTSVRMAFTRRLISGFIALIFVVLIYLTFIQKRTDTVFEEGFIGNKDDTIKFETNTVPVQRHISDSFVSGIRDIANKVNNYIDTRKIDNSKLHRYVKDEMKFENIKHINVAIKSELEELRSRGIQIGDIPDINQSNSSEKDISSSEQEEIDQKETKEEENIEENNELENNEKEKNSYEHVKQEVLKEEQEKQDDVKQKFKYRNPEVSDLEKLTAEQLDIERDTDPLSGSVVCSEEVFLIVLVISKPENEDRRNSIRDSWANSYADDVTKLKNSPKAFQGGRTFAVQNVFKTVFVLGQSKAGSSVMNKVREEVRLKKDIVFGNLTEDYRNLTMKTRLGLKWAYYECQSTYIVKTDDDVFVNPVMLVEWLKEMPEEKLYTGWCNFNSPVVRDKRNKWYISYEDFSEKVYPGYCLGGGYLMSDDVLGAFLKLSYGRKLFPMEDLYVGLLVKELGDVKVNDQREHFNLIYGGNTRLCDMNKLFLAHQVFGEKQVEHIKNAREALSKC